MFLIHCEIIIKNQTFNLAGTALTGNGADQLLWNTCKRLPAFLFNIVCNASCSTEREGRNFDGTVER